MKRIFGFLSLLFSLLAIGFFVRETFELYTTQQSAAQYLTMVWQNDIETLEKANKLPEEWSRIGRIELNPATELASSLQPELRVPIQAHSSGDHALEILLIVLQETRHIDVVVQYNLLDPQENLIWELGRTFKLPYPAQPHRDDADQIEDQAPPIDEADNKTSTN